MNYVKELTRKVILDDLKNYRYPSVSDLNDAELDAFYDKHIFENSEDIKVTEIFSIKDRILVNSLDGYVEMGQKVVKRDLECFTVTLTDGRKISCSFNHLVETTKGWTKVNELTKKDLLLTDEGFIKVKNIRKIKTQDVYDFEVFHENHRYLTANGISSHNTGKTYLSCARALKFLKDDPFTYKKIVLIKSVNVPKDEEIGYLKGTMEEKMELYTYPFISNFIKVIGKQATDELKAARAIEILPIKFALGVTLDNSIIIVDEAQQISKDNLRTIITRLGQDSKMIFLGDIKQKSVNKHSKSALEVLLQHFSDIAGVGVIQLGVEDIVRHPIIKQLVEVFDKIENIEHLNGK